MNHIVSKVRVAVIVLYKPPSDLLADWIKSVSSNVPKTAKGLKQAIACYDDYLNKIGQPAQQATARWLNPNIRTKSGLTYQEILKKTSRHIDESYRKYKRKLNTAFKNGAEKFFEAILLKAYKSCWRMSQLSLPFSGYGKQVRGVAPFAIDWLSGNETVLEQLQSEDNLSVGGPVLIVKQKQIGKFRQKLFNRLCQAGSRIVKSGYEPVIIRRENDLTNELVNQFLNPPNPLLQRGKEDDFVSFSTGGESSRLGRDGVYPEERRAVASHVDYIMENEQPFLEIQVTRQLDKSHR